MTRAEAIAKLDAATPEGTYKTPHELIVDALQTLGVIQLDKPAPPSLELRLTDAMRDLTPPGGPVMFPGGIRAALEKAGLELVEKK